MAHSCVTGNNYFIFLITCRYYSIQLFLDRTAPYLSGGRAFGRTSGRTSGRRACRQRRRKKNHLIEVAPFGRLDQM